jgi:molybdopterin converting factor small subunit
MIVHVKLFASLRRYRPGPALGQAFACNVPDDATVEQLVGEVLHLPAGEVAISLVNGVYQKRGYRLTDGDHVALWPPIAGGAQ